MTVLRWTIGDVVRKLRDDRGWTQRQFADKAGIATTAANRLEKTSDLSDQRTIRKAAQALGVPVSLFYRYAEFMTVFVELNEAQQGRVLDLMHEFALMNATQNPLPTASTTPAENLATDESAPPMRARQRR